ncbi:unnamed protein product [Lymnaea stagnalis]|uniref:PKD domain-containing protein n=1 Tax=Lymnaea stagnalis TaxID=6523 RepID=A0AAV2HDA4_LYMST
MAYNNKQHKLTPNMLLLDFFFILICISSVSSAIFSFNKKFSHVKNLMSSEIVNSDNNVFNFNKQKIAATVTDETSKLEVGVLSEFIHRTKRETAANTPEILKNRVLLNGTEKSTHAYVHWIGKDTSERIFVLTCRVDYKNRREVVDSQLWRSDDYGSSYKEMKFESEAKISFIYTFPSNYKKLIFTDIMAKKIYTTEDELTTNKSYVVEVEPDLLIPHPTDDNKFLLYSFTQRKLFVSVNFGANFKLLSEDVLPNFYWGESGFDKNPDIVHMEIEGGMPSQAMYKSCIVPDCTNEPNPELQDVGPFLATSLTTHKEYMFVQKSNWNGSENYLAVSHQRKAFQRAYFPGDLKTNDFMLLNLDGGQVFVAVNHGDVVNLYLSDAVGQYYVLSMENIYHVMRLDWFEIDFHEVKGMNWTFLANKRISTQSGMVARTYISYDKGGNWAPLYINQSCKGIDSCALQLQISQGGLVTPIFSEANAVGIIMAHGILGTSSIDQTPFVFTSRDGGANWIKAEVEKMMSLNGTFRFNILDQGSILTAVPDGLVTGLNSSTIYFSLDQGSTWTSQLFDNQGLIVKGVLTEPGITTLVESVFGHEVKDKPWTLIKLNFSLILPVKCEEANYTFWQPKDYNSANASNCLLGSDVKYKQRKADDKCYNGGSVVLKQENVTCLCTAEDYECDFGYEYHDGECKKALWFHEGYILSDCDDGGTYQESKGYRQIPADNCFEGSDMGKYGRTAKQCPLAAPIQLSILGEGFNVQAGKEVIFHLEQAGGSKFDTNYSWNFGDLSSMENVTGIKQASPRKHIFHESGHYNITVTASNSKGSLLTWAYVHVQDSISNTYLSAPWAVKTGLQVAFNLVVSSHTRLMASSSGHVHFVWTFGDETGGSLPILTWNSSMSHVYTKAGTYKVTFEAINSISAVYKEYSIQVFDQVDILVLKFSDNVAMYNMSDVLVAQLFTQRVRQQLAEDIGVRLDRLEAVLVSLNPVAVHLYIFPSTQQVDVNVTQVKAVVYEQVEKGVLGINLFVKTYDSDNIVKIVSATDLTGHPNSTDGVSEGINMKPIYIAVPVLVLALIVSGVSLMYCRKKVHSIRQYNMLHTQDDSDAMLDDDEAPLDLNVDFGIRESSRDDNMLENTGGSHLVMVTGGSTDHSVNC